MSDTNENTDSYSKAESDLNSNIGNSYSEGVAEDTIAEAGRVIVRIGEIKDFRIGENSNNENLLTASSNELAIGTDDNGVPHVGVIYRNESNGNLEFISGSKLNSDRISAMDKLGMFDNLEAFANNRRIHNLFFDNVTRRLRLNSSAMYPLAYKYYAVRKLSYEIGEDPYITGILDSEGNVMEKLVSMTQEVMNVSVVDGSAIYGMVANDATILTGCALVDRERYIVEFYDSTKTLIAQELFYAKAIINLTYASISKTSVVRMFCVFANTAISSEEAKTATETSLYEYSDKELLSYRVYLEFADGTIKDVTHEDGNRLNVTGWDTIDTSITTGVNDNLMGRLTFSYILDQIDTSISSQDTTIYADYDVRIIPDPSTVYYRLEPVATIDMVNGIRYLRLKIFGIDKNEDGTSADIFSTRDLTYIVKNSVTLKSPITGKSMVTTAEMFSTVLGNCILVPESELIAAEVIDSIALSLTPITNNIIQVDVNLPNSYTGGTTLYSFKVIREIPAEGQQTLLTYTVPVSSTDYATKLRHHKIGISSTDTGKYLQSFSKATSGDTVSRTSFLSAFSSYLAYDVIENNVSKLGEGEDIYISISLAYKHDGTRLSHGARLTSYMDGLSIRLNETSDAYVDDYTPILFELYKLGADGETITKNYGSCVFMPRSL